MLFNVSRNKLLNTPVLYSIEGMSSRMSTQKTFTESSTNNTTREKQTKQKHWENIWRAIVARFRILSLHWTRSTRVQRVASCERNWYRSLVALVETGPPSTPLQAGESDLGLSHTAAVRSLAVRYYLWSIQSRPGMSKTVGTILDL